MTQPRLATAAPERGTAALIAGVASVGVVVLYAALLDHRPTVTALLVFTVVSVVVLVVTLVLTVLRRKLLAIAGLLLAVSPAALSGVAAGKPSGALAVLWACAAIAVAWWGHLLPTVAVTIAVVAALISAGRWYSDSVDQVIATPWGEVLTSTGDLLRWAVGTLGG